MPSPSSYSAYKVFTRGAVISLLGVLLSGILSYFIRRVLVLRLSPEEYGFFYSAFAFVSLGLAVVDLGLGNSGTVLIAKYAARGKMVRVNLFFSIILLLKIMTGLFLALLIWFWAPRLVEDYFSFVNGLPTMFCLAFFIPLQAVSGFVVSSLGAMKGFGSRTLFQTIYYGTILGLVSILTSHFKTLAPALAYCGAAALVLVLGMFYLKARYGLKLVWRYRRWVMVWPETLIYARWLTMSVIAIATMNYVDTLMLTWLSDLHSVAGYQVALPIAQIARSLVFLSIIFMPIAADLWQRRQLTQIKDICDFVTLLMIFCVGAGFLLLLALSGDLIALLFDDRYRWVAPTLLVMGSGMPLLVVAQFYLNTLNSMDRPKTAAMAALAGLFANIFLNLILIPCLGALGAALATVLSFIVIAFFSYLDLRHELALRLSWRPIIFLLVIVFAAIAGHGLCGEFAWESIVLPIYCGSGFFLLRSRFIALKDGSKSQ